MHGMKAYVPVLIIGYLHNKLWDKTVLWTETVPFSELMRLIRYKIQLISNYMGRSSNSKSIQHCCFFFISNILNIE